MTNLQTKQFATNLGWCWFQDPRAVYYNGHTYWGGVAINPDSGKNGDVMIYQFNHLTGRIREGYLAQNFQDDDHDAPAIVIKPDGRIMAFFSGHSGSKMWYRTSLNAEDITAFDGEKWVGPATDVTGVTYPNPQYLSTNQKLFMHWRNANGRASLSITTDWGANSETSWSTRRMFANLGSRPYFKVAGDGATKIHYAINDSHPTDNAVNNLFHFYYDDSDQKYYKSDDTLIKTFAQMTSSPLLAGDMTKVYNSAATERKSWIWDIAINSSGNPVVVFATFTSTGTDHRYHYAQFNGSTWDVEELTTAGGTIHTGGTEPFYSGGVCLDHSDTDVVYLSREVSGVFQLERWEWNGTSWDTTVVDSTGKNMRPLVPRNHDGVDLMWQKGEYPGYTLYKTDILAAGN